jgi:hypothetical protein
MKRETDLLKKEKLPPKKEVELGSLVYSDLTFGGANRQLVKTKSLSQGRERQT